MRYRWVAVRDSSDLIVMCIHGKSGLSGWFVGSIAQQVIGMGSVPVLLISPEGQNAEFSCQEILIPPWASILA